MLVFVFLLCYYPYSNRTRTWTVKEVSGKHLLLQTAKRKTWNKTECLSTSLQTRRTVLHLVFMNSVGQDQELRY